MHIEPLSRSRQFAKLLEYRGRQALVYLHRTADDDLIVMVLVWSDAADMQLCATVTVENDDQAMVAFDSITNDTIAEFMDSTGMTEALGE